MVDVSGAELADPVHHSHGHHPRRTPPILLRERLPNLVDVLLAERAVGRDGRLGRGLLDEDVEDAVRLGRSRTAGELAQDQVVVAGRESRPISCWKPGQSSPTSMVNGMNPRAVNTSTDRLASVML